MDPDQYRKKHPWDNLPTTPHIKVVSVAHIVNEYLQSPRWLNLSETSKEKYLSTFRIFEKYVIYTGKTIYDLAAYKVTFSTVDYFHKTLAYTHKPASIRFYFSVWYMVWHHAVRAGRVYTNPWASPYIKVNNERDITWTRDEVRKFLSVTRELGYDVLFMYVLLCYETAQRPWKDLTNITWNDIKTEKTDKGEERTYLDLVISKTKTRLLVPLSATTVTALEAWPKISNFILVDEQGYRVNKFNLYKQFAEVKERAGLPAHLLIRDLRRTAFTELAENGASSLEIEAISGWRCPEAVIRRYARVRLKTAYNALQKREQDRAPDDTIFCPKVERTT